MLKKILFVDLDDTIFQSFEKCEKGVELKPTAFLKDGSPISYMSPKQRSFLSFAGQGTTMIPTTARNLNAFRRVRLDWSSYVILNYGGVILNPDGGADTAWLDRTRANATKALPGLQHAVKLLDDYASRKGLSARARIIEDFGVPFYVVIKDSEKIAARLEKMERDVLNTWVKTEGKDYYIHRNGNNLAVLPLTLNKANAVAYLSQKLKQEFAGIVTFGMGDSKSDARFMAACDYAIVPQGSQLASMTLETL
jgi:hydroxymethylpyrimidine pyrophosphatase-like HAD family hydrolase